MMDSALKEQLRSIFAPLEGHYTLLLRGKSGDKVLLQAEELIIDVADSSANIEFRMEEGDALTLGVLRGEERLRLTFRAVPTAHEFSSLILAIMNADGKGRNIPDEFVVERIKAITQRVEFKTYISLTCTNCPDVVQALNLISILNPNISHEVVDGALYRQEMEQLNIQSVPTVYANGELLSVGRSSLTALLDKIEERFATTTTQSIEREYDLIIAGGGPAGVTAAIYSARKGRGVAIITDRVGGQVNETAHIENISSIIRTTGSKLAEDLMLHTKEYNIDIFDSRTIESFTMDGSMKRLSLKGGEDFIAPQMIISTGATWRKLNIEGEMEYIGRGVAFCPHCDGPIFKARRVAVIGGGNSGVEAAIDLSSICSEVTLIEFLPELKADGVLQQRLRSLDNVKILLNTLPTKIEGDGQRVVALHKRDRASEQMERIEIDGIFVQIGLTPNSSLFKEVVELNSMGEIVTDKSCRTSVEGIYAAGDVSDVAYKQIIISMGEGAVAALSAFSDLIT